MLWPVPPPQVIKLCSSAPHCSACAAGREADQHLRLRAQAPVEALAGQPQLSNDMGNAAVRAAEQQRLVSVVPALCVLDHILRQRLQACLTLLLPELLLQARLIRSPRTSKSPGWLKEPSSADSHWHGDGGPHVYRSLACSLPTWQQCPVLSGTAFAHCLLITCESLLEHWADCMPLTMEDCTAPHEVLQMAHLQRALAYAHL